MLLHEYILTDIIVIIVMLFVLCNASMTKQVYGGGWGRQAVSLTDGSLQANHD